MLAYLVEFAYTDSFGERRTGEFWVGADDLRVLDRYDPAVAASGIVAGSAESHVVETALRMIRSGKTSHRLGNDGVVILVDLFDLDGTRHPRRHHIGHPA